MDPLTQNNINVFNGHGIETKRMKQKLYSVSS